MKKVQSLYRRFPVASGKHLQSVQPKPKVGASQYHPYPVIGGQHFQSLLRKR